MDPLAQLKDIHLPEQVGVWPLAPGWWLVIALILIFAVVEYFLIKGYRAKKYKRIAVKKLVNASDKQAIRVILKQLCLSYFPRDQVANLYGSSWQQFLIDQLKLKHQDQFRRLSDGLFSDAPINNSLVNGDKDPLVSYREAAVFWIKNTKFNLHLNKNSRVTGAFK